MWKWDYWSQRCILISRFRPTKNLIRKQQTTLTVRQLLQQLCVACSIDRSFQAMEYKPAITLFQYCLQIFISHITVMEIKLYYLCTLLVSLQTCNVYVYIACPLFLSVSFGPQAQRNPNKETVFYESPTSCNERTSHMLQMVHSCMNLWQELLNFPPYRQSAKWRNSQIMQLHKLNYVQISCYFSFGKNRA